MDLNPSQAWAIVGRDQIRQIVEEAVARALHTPSLGEVNPRHFARVTFVTDQGEEWRGAIYPVETVSEEGALHGAERNSD